MRCVCVVAGWWWWCVRACVGDSFFRGEGLVGRTSSGMCNSSTPAKLVMPWQ